MKLKKLFFTLISTICISYTTVDTVFAANLNWVSNIIKETKYNNKVALSLCFNQSINTQLSSLFDKVASELDLDKQYVKILYKLAGGNAEYYDLNANIYNDLTVIGGKAPMYISGSKTVYQKAPFSECNENLQRPSAYYMPDAVYSVSYDIRALMTQRSYYNRGAYQEYFESLTDKTKSNILFYESVLLYTGEDVDNVNNFFVSYIKIIETKGTNEKIIKSKDGKLVIKDKYIKILKDNGISDKDALEKLAIMLNYDTNLETYDNSDYITQTNILPYIVNYTSRENMMIAATCLVGKVRYTWGGGHSGTCKIDGINPCWYNWNTLYNNDSYGKSKCIRSKQYWCPTHGSGSGTFHGRTVFSAQDYINLRKDELDFTKYTYDDYMQAISQINFSRGVNEHLIDGLDCSGYVSWVYNQITNRYSYDASAMAFTSQYGIDEIKFGSELLPGDIFSWNSHIVLIVGKVRDGSKAYVTLEQTPNVLRFGTVYYSGASSSDISNALEIANQANELIGGIDRQSEPAKCYCMNNVGHYTETEIETEVDEETGEEIENEVTVEKYYTSIGRFRGQFIDDNTVISKYKSKFKDMTAKEIIEYTLTKLPVSYVSGFGLYKGNLFNIDDVSSSVGVTLTDTDNSK